MKNFKFTINGNQYEVNILNIEENIAELEVNGTTYQVEVDKSIQTTKTPKLVRSISVPSNDLHPSSARTSSPDSPKGGGNIKAPLPGVVLELYVKEGDTVKIGQRLMMLEAMKMENNIDADKPGTIISIKKHKGDSVMEGDVLITIG
ncbi:MAG TPA: acetyl-CoA carboxylase biotin carboxyl carrier protein subunit [Bacteroidales bacterium]|nr:MAG: acetyl-CoA carboxylase biotin carboxyl carrier protein subunit [Bacteroidetes bacterium GWE2_42_24]OFY27366.1 MAG: acetyl-CoA carboxylase biotin carboxyl carrier protein subunit [Bacteroidetes bacterium GWF2_43_11]PKP17138.1 MAG: acetyl-CoA carboxylase biotin carboxyl carrier protein subunit [Bacteroidetes bacterium HGW-Bacteroidetes-22]HAQ65006.1 acetyl-CoA carboxylase biotin carboxyl carrier protein subunit [Bacteroidales bacterium]HBZ65878.1 acetyl-CoA carboxylase biotin carboxyl car